MSIQIDHFDSDAMSVVLSAEDEDSNAMAMLAILSDYLWESLGIEVEQSTLIITMVFPDDSGEHAA